MIVKRKRRVSIHPVPGRTRGGVTSVEMAVVVSMFLTLILGMMDLSLAIFRYHIASQSARQAARIAIVHGELAPPEQTNWLAEPGVGESAVTGTPPTYGPTAMNTGLGIADSPTLLLSKYITGLTPANTTLKYQWIDGNSQLGSRITATVSTTYTPFVSWIFVGNFTLVGESTMEIAH